MSVITAKERDRAMRAYLRRYARERARAAEAMAAADHALNQAVALGCGSGEMALHLGISKQSAGAQLRRTGTRPGW